MILEFEGFVVDFALVFNMMQIRAERSLIHSIHAFIVGFVRHLPFVLVVFVMVVNVMVIEERKSAESIHSSLSLLYCTESTVYPFFDIVETSPMVRRLI